MRARSNCAADMARVAKPAAYIRLYPSMRNVTALDSTHHAPRDGRDEIGLRNRSFDQPVAAARGGHHGGA